ncbi:butyrophilin subfamily 2 member A2-like [Lycodopsis pacificus]
MSSPHVVFFCLLTCCGFTSGLRHGVLTVLAQAGSDVILPCSLGNKDIQSLVFDWKKDGVMEVFLYSGGDEYNNGRAGQSEQFRGRVSHFEDELKHGNASIIITNTKMADSGHYTCVFPRLQTGSQTQHVQLVVGCDPPCSTLKNQYGEADGASPEPSISIVSVTDIAVQLECVVRGASPRPQLEWRDGDGNVLRADEPRVSSRGDVSLQTTVTTSTKQTSTSTFICVATQEEIDHQINANITLSGKLFENTCSKVDVTGWIGGTFLGIVLVLAVQAVIIISCKKGWRNVMDSEL